METPEHPWDGRRQTGHGVPGWGQKDPFFWPNRSWKCCKSKQKTTFLMYINPSIQHSPKEVLDFDLVRLDLSRLKVTIKTFVSTTYFNRLLQAKNLTHSLLQCYSIPSFSCKKIKYLKELNLFAKYTYTAVQCSRLWGGLQSKCNSAT